MIRTCSYLKDHRVLMTGLALLSMALAPQMAWGQWQTSGSNIYYSNGSVGIGTTTPTVPLDVVGGGINETAYNTQPVFRLQTAHGTPTSPTATQSGDSMGFIGMKGYGATGFTTQLGAGIGAIAAETFTDSANGTHLTFGTTPAGVAVRLERMRITDAGNVGIGTTNPQYNLAVFGNIGAQDVIVTNTGWSDYVFRPGYRLRPLSEVSQFIQANGHLPDIPTEAEVREKGVSLGDIQAKLLAKVEELTLHMIQQEKENRDLRENLTKENQQLRDRLARLEKSATTDSAPAVAK